MFASLYGIEEPSAVLTALDIVFITILGLCMGSFASALIHRIPLSQSWAGGRSRSRCPECAAILRVRDLVPLFSWLFYKGRCRHCKARVSPLYPALELICAALALCVFLFMDAPPLQVLIALAALPFLLAMLVIDIRHKILPNMLVAIFAALGLLYVAALTYEHGVLAPVLFTHGAGAILFAALSAVVALIMKAVLKKSALGMGDVKFFAAAGLWLGVPLIGTYYILSGALGVALGLVWRAATGEARFPFGPALITAFLLLLLLDGSFLLEKTLH